LINRSVDKYDSTYACIWSDIDNGDAGDDFEGCDSTLGLMYCYNAIPNDGEYGNKPPAVGFDFIQGPFIDGKAGEDKNRNGLDDAIDYAFFKGEKYGPGKINLPMTAHPLMLKNYWISNDPNLGDYTYGTLAFFNLFKGKGTSGRKILDPVTGKESYFSFSGDPVSGTGWIDGTIYPPGDRRQVMVTGPFEMMPGDTQEVVIAEITAGGSESVDHLQAVTLLKKYDEIIQSIYDNQFNSPRYPQPAVLVSELDRQIVLNWGFDQISVNETENFVDKSIKGLDSYRFQGYNVYQLPNAEANQEEGIRIATFDIIDGVKVIFDQFPEPNSGQPEVKAVQYGGDYGIKRSMLVDKDYLNNTPLYNGSKYYFAVTAYTFNPDPLAVPKTVESPLRIFEAIPKSLTPGIGIEYNYGDKLSAEHSAGISFGTVQYEIINPEMLNGHEYEVTFDILPEFIDWNNARGSNDTLHNQTLWNLKDITTGEYKLVKQINLTGDDESPIADGLRIRVKSASLDFNDVIVTQNASGPLDPPQAAFPNWISDLPPTFSTAEENFIEQQEMGAWWFLTEIGLQITYMSIKNRWTQYTGGFGNWPGMQWIINDDWEIRFTSDGSEALWAWNDPVVIKKVPFELWNIGDPGITEDDYRCVVLIMDNDSDGLFDLNDDDHPISPDNDDPYTDAVYWVVPQDDTPGTAGYEAVMKAIKTDPLKAAEKYLWAYWDDDYHTWPGMHRMNFTSWNAGEISEGTDYGQSLPEEGTVFRIKTVKPLSPRDKYTFTAPLVEYNEEQAKKDIDKINVFPNPFYGINSGTLNGDAHVTFNHLPDRVKITIVNLAGYTVNVIDKDNISQFQQWDLKNDKGKIVAPGLYLVYIDMPELNKIKVLKLGIFSFMSEK
ncbi:MAG: hypothetical protein JW995_03895, partial [Melioribacteraceae bacterium]|nr:hypothetical protein [Melioribacteraceae bacterium]